MFVLVFLDLCLTIWGGTGAEFHEKKDLCLVGEVAVEDLVFVLCCWDRPDRGLTGPNHRALYRERCGMGVW